MVVQHNIPAINSHRNLLVNNTATAKNLEKLSSGYRINRAGDDAAGLAISEKMRGQIRGLAKAEENTQNAISLIQTAEGGMQEMHNIIQRMRELAVQASNGTYADDVDREALDLEYKALMQEFDRIADYTNYNGIKLLDGSVGLVYSNAAALTTAGDVKVGNANFVGNIGFSGTAITWDATANSLDVELTFDKDGKLTGVSGTLKVGNTELTLDGATFDVSSGAGIEIELTGGQKITIDAANDYRNAVTDKNGALVGTLTLSASNTNNTALTAALANYTETHVAEDNSLIFQVGANGFADQRIDLTIAGMYARNLGRNADGLNVGDPNDFTNVAASNILNRDNANMAINVLDVALNEVSMQRANLGAVQNRLEYTLNNLGVTKENLTSAESVIRDVDMAKEMMEFTKNQILVQASQAMLATANQLPQGILNLLR